jgi:2-alkyl-3-oxoalkanoate reductase
MTHHRILLTGATGFIGQHVHRALLNEGHDVVAVVRPERRDVPLDPRCTVIRANLLDRSAMAAALEQVTAVVAIAGAVRGSTVDDFRKVNTEAIGVLRDVLHTHHAPVPLLLMSSIAASVPALSDYSASKRAGEDLITQSDVIPWCVLRPPAVYGPGEKDLRPLLAWLARGLIIVPGNPRQRISFIHVADLTAACLSWLEHHGMLSGRRFTIDDGQPGGYDWPSIEAAVCKRVWLRVVLPPTLLKTLGAMNGWVADLLGKPPMLSPGKVREMMNDRWVNTGDTEGNPELTAATGWQPRWTLRTGVAETLKSRS